jgi:hypothetical protein
MDEEAEPLKSIGQRRPLTPAESKTLRELQ